MARTNRKLDTANLDAILAGIAQGRLGIDTLETRNNDDLDIHEVAVWQVRKALLQAYTWGYAQGASDKGRHVVELTNLVEQA